MEGLRLKVISADGYTAMVAMAPHLGKGRTNTLLAPGRCGPVRTEPEGGITQALQIC